jgi:hypothetical protein
VEEFLGGEAAFRRDEVVVLQDRFGVRSARENRREYSAHPLRSTRPGFFGIEAGRGTWASFIGFALTLLFGSALVDRVGMKRM